MENSFEIEGEFSELIKNPAGIPGKKVDSSKVRNGHADWKKNIKERKDKHIGSLCYWERASTCNML